MRIVSVARSFNSLTFAPELHVALAMELEIVQNSLPMNDRDSIANVIGTAFLEAFEEYRKTNVIK